MIDKYQDLPQEEIVEMMKDMIGKGFDCYVKWTCEKCGGRATCNLPNIFFTKGLTHENCGHTSNPTKFGLMVMKRFKGGK